MRQVVAFVFFVFCFVSEVTSQGNLWREDGRCGNSGKHCCKLCQDYSKLIGVLVSAETQKSSPQPIEKEYGNRAGVLESLIPQEQQDDFFNSLWNILSEPVSYIVEGWNDNKNELPDKVATYVEKVATNGAQVFGDFYNETKKEVIQKAIAGSVDDLTNILESFIGKIENVYKSVESVVYQRAPLSDEQIKLRKERKNLSATKKELDSLGEILPLERKENNALGGLEGLLLGLVTEAREIISLLSGEGDLAWSKLKQLEVESYQVLNL